MTILRFAVLAIVMALGAPGQWLNYPTAGLPRTPDGKPDLAAPTPKTGDGKPDLSGIWLPADNTHFMDLAADLKPEDARISRGREIWPPIDRKGCIKMIPWRSACRLAPPRGNPRGASFQNHSDAPPTGHTPTKPQPTTSSDSTNAATKLASEFDILNSQRLSSSPPFLQERVYTSGTGALTNSVSSTA